MGGGDLNAKKAWHPNTLKNQERVWKAEQAAAEEKKRIAELERERLVERDRAELNKLAKSSLAHSALSGDDRLHWMYEKPDKKVQQEEFLLGKAIDKNHEQAGKSVTDEIPAVSRRVVGASMLTMSGDTQVDLARKMREDPLLLVKERERAARAALLNNPVQRARLTELLRNEQKSKEKKSKKKKKKSVDLDNILAEKLQALGGKKGIDLASLLASDDSSSESSDEKSKKKKKKKKSKSKNKTLSDDDSGERKHKSKKYSSKESKKNISSEKEREDYRNDKHFSKRHRHSESSDNTSEVNNLERKHKSSYDSKEESKKYSSGNKKRNTIESDKVSSGGKKRHYSFENESFRSHVKKHRSNSSETYLSSDDQKPDDRIKQTTRNCVTENRYWDDESQLRDKYATSERQSKKAMSSRNSGDNRERASRQKEVGSHRSSNNLVDSCKNEKDKRHFRQNASQSDKSWQSHKRSGLTEEEKAAKLAEMVADGAEREKQRERRVADQLVEKEMDNRPNTHSRSSNVIRQLPDSLESRLHSNRHYIQRDQRHMNENFARR